MSSFKQPNLLSSSDRILRLDVLRAIAIIGVFVFHYGNNLPAPLRATTIHSVQGGINNGAAAAFGPVLDYGSSGVALIFVISGFCIHHSYLRHSAEFKMGNFYWRRFLRIYPPYLVALLFFSALGLVKMLSALNLKMFLSHLFLIHDFFDHRVFFSINAAFWSLAVEWQLYLLFPLVLMLRRRVHLQAALLISLLFCLGDQLACLVSPVYWHFSQHEFCGGVLLDSWCVWILGACLAEAHTNGRIFFRHGLLWLISTVALFGAVSVLNLPFGAKFLGHGLFFTVVMDFYLRWGRPLTLLERLLVPVGLVSYSIYLWHMPLVKPLSRWLHATFVWPDSVLGEVLFFIPSTALILSPIFVLSYFLFEKRLPALIARRMAPPRLEGLDGLSP